MDEKVARADTNVEVRFGNVLAKEGEKGADGGTAPCVCTENTEDQPVIDGQEPRVIGGGAPITVYGGRCGHFRGYFSRTEGGKSLQKGCGLVGPIATTL